MNIKETMKKYEILRCGVQRLYYLYYSLLTIISPALNTKVRYKKIFGRKLDLENPQTLNEKILKMKLESYATDPLIRKCADKYAVRSYVKESGVGEILVPLIASYDKVDEIEWKKLPNSFVMKWNYGCGFNIVCLDKEKADVLELKNQMKKWSKVRYYLPYSEMQYKGVQKKIIVEKYLKPQHGKLPDDYKVYCFNGKAMYVMLCVGRENGHAKYLYYDRNFQFMRDFSYDGIDMPEDFELEKPEGYGALFFYAEKLSAPFKFVRADFYLVDGQVYFGELTFTPSAGLDAGRIPEVDNLFGKLLDI